MHWILGGMVGLVLGVLRLVFIILGVESSFSSSSSSSSVGVAAGTNIGVSTFGAAAAIRHFRQKNISFRTFFNYGCLRFSRKKKDEYIRRSNNDKEDDKNMKLIHDSSSALPSNPSIPSHISGVRNKQFLLPNRS
jgi:hypothetical protein